jgi:hypothetical protein
MNTTLILVQFASQNVALFCCALVAGAAVYVSLVEHPAIAEAGGKLAVGYLLFSQPRPVLYQGAFGVIGGIAGIVAGIAGGDFSRLAGGVMLLVSTLYQLTVVVPATRKVTSLAASDQAAELPRRLARLSRINAVQSLGSLAALLIFILRA